MSQKSPELSTHSFPLSEVYPEIFNDRTMMKGSWQMSGWCSVHHSAPSAKQEALKKDPVDKKSSVKTTHESVKSDLNTNQMEQRDWADLRQIIYPRSGVKGH